MNRALKLNVVGRADREEAIFRQFPLKTISQTFRQLDALHPIPNISELIKGNMRDVCFEMSDSLPLV
jgi:hypothetical protein